MAIATMTPVRFALEDDYPLVDGGPDCPFNNETFNLWCYDPVERIGLNVHLVAGGGDFSTFHTTVILYAGADILAGEFRGAARPDGADAGPLQATIVEPLKRWHYDFLGRLGRTDPVASRATPFAEMATELVAFDLVVEMASPPIEQGTQGDDGVTISSGTIARTARRYEQLARVRGTVRIGMRKIAVNALGMRVHRRNSAGIYESGVVGHSWLTGLFPSGRGFHVCAYQNEPLAQVGFCHGLYFDGERYHTAEVLKFPYYSGEIAEEYYEIALGVDSRRIEIQGLPATPYLRGFSRQNMLPIRFTRAPGHFLLDGEVGGGVLERSLHEQYAAGGNFEAARLAS